MAGEVLDKIKARDFNATSLSTYDFSALNMTLPCNLIKDKLIDLIEETSIEKALLTLHVTTVLDKIKARDFNTTSLSTYYFSTLLVIWLKIKLLILLKEP